MKVGAAATSEDLGELDDGRSLVELRFLGPVREGIVSPGGQNDQGSSRET